MEFALHITYELQSHTLGFNFSTHITLCSFFKLFPDATLIGFICLIEFFYKVSNGNNYNLLYSFLHSVA